MFQWNRLPGWLMLASYLLANTLSALWHDHPGCSDCGTSLPFEQCQRHAPGEHAHQDCDHHHGDGDADHESTPEEPQQQGAAGHGCAVCDFLALAPLPATLPELTDAEQAVSTLLPVLVSRSGRCAPHDHLARGPPVAG